MKKIRFCLFAGLFIMFYSCNYRDNVWNEDSNRVSREVRKTLDMYYKDVVAGGFKAEFNYLDSSAMFKWHPPGFADSIGYDSVRQILLQNADVYKVLHMRMDSLIIFPVSRKEAKYSGFVYSVMQDTSGRKDTVQLYEQGIMMNREYGWKLVKGKTVVRE